MHPTTLVHSLAPFCAAFCSSFPLLPSTSFMQCYCPCCCLLHLSCQVPDLCAHTAQTSSSHPTWVGARGWTKTLQSALRASLL